MTIRYTVTRADLVLAQIRALVRNRFILTLWGALIVWVCYSSLRTPTAVKLSLGLSVVFALITAFLITAAVFGFTVTAVSAMILLRKNKGVLGEHRLTIREDGLHEVTDYNDSLHRWAAYHRTVSTKSYLLIYPTDGMFFSISKRRPLLEGDMSAFERELNAKTKKA